MDSNALNRSTDPQTTVPPAANGLAGPDATARLSASSAVVLLLLLGAGLWAYWPTLVEAVTAWSSQPDYSHGFLVLPIAAAFLWFRRDRLPQQAARPSAWGLSLLLAASLIRIGAARYYLQPIDSWTIPLWAMGVVWATCGAAYLRWALPSLIFLWFMFPIPYSSETWFSQPLQSLATKVSTAALVMLGQPALAEGNVIWLNDQTLNIAEACSGLRIFVGILALAFAFVLFSRWSWWQKALAVAAVFPIAIFANALRIVGTGLLYQYASGETARRFFHDVSGIAMIPIAALMFWAFLVYLERLFPVVEQVSMLRGFDFSADE